MVEADEGDLESDEESYERSSGQKESDDTIVEEGVEVSDFKESEPGFLDDVYGLMGGFDGQDYDDEDDSLDVPPKTPTKAKSH
jgi:hypothetical protein